MYKHVNVQRKINKISERFRESLTMFEEKDDFIFFNIVNFLGCYTAALFKTHYSASDCCNTVEILEKLFGISESQIKNINKQELENIFEMKGDYFYNFKITGKVPFHTFVVVKYKNIWFLLQSFANICGLYVYQDLDIPKRLLSFLEAPTIEEYNSLFGAKLSVSISTIVKVDALLTYQKIDELPLKRLRELLEKFISK